MHDHELDAWLDGTPATHEQRTALHRAADLAETRYPGADAKDDRGAAFTAAAQVILGDATLEIFAGEWARARTAERDAMAALTGAIIAASATTAESAIAARTGINRMTIRKALGK